MSVDDRHVYRQSDFVRRKDLEKVDVTRPHTRPIFRPVYGDDLGVLLPKCHFALRVGPHGCKGRPPGKRFHVCTVQN